MRKSSLTEALKNGSQSSQAQQETPPQHLLIQQQPLQSAQQSEQQSQSTSLTSTMPISISKRSDVEDLNQASSVTLLTSSAAELFNSQQQKTKQRSFEFSIGTLPPSGNAMFGLHPYECSFKK